MGLSAGYGETPLPNDDLQALLPAARAMAGTPPLRAAVYDVEQAVQAEVAEELVLAVLTGNLSLQELLTDNFLRELHASMYGDIWKWAGRFRKRELNIGVPPELVAVAWRESVDNVSYRWQNTRDWTARHLGMVMHAEVGRVHPFVDGNGRTARLLADLVYLAAQEPHTLEVYNWDVEKSEYISLLREYDRHRDPNDLTEFVSTQSLSGDS